jgi:hypothetical protein
VFRKAYGVLLVLVAAFAIAPTALAGEVALGVTSTAPQQLVQFDTATPGTIVSRAFVVGLQPGERVTGMDVRPATGEVLAVTSTNRMLIVDPATGVARQAGVAVEAPFNGAVASGFDFNPTVDRLRLASTAANLRWNPVNSTQVDSIPGGALDPDTSVAFKIADPNNGDTPSVVGAAYTNNDDNGATPTTLFGIESGNDALIRQGAVDGNGADVAGGGSPNTGQLTTIGSLGVLVDDGSFDISSGPTGTGNVAWAALHQTADTASKLYTVNLATGAATLVGTIAAGDKVGGLTILPGGSLRVTSAARVAESAGKAVIRVARIGDTLAPVQVTFRTSARTATASADYTQVAGVLSFAQGERTKDVTVTVAKDGVAEPAETFAFELGTPVGSGAVVDTPISIVEIAENLKPAFLAAPVAPDTLRALRKAGKLAVDYACSSACVVTLTLKMGKTTLGTAHATRGSLGVSRVSLRITTAGKKALATAAAAKGGRVKLTLAGTATDTAGNAASRSTTLSVRRR